MYSFLAKRTTILLDMYLQIQLKHHPDLKKARQANKKHQRTDQVKSDQQHRSNP